MPLIHTCYRITDVDRSVAFYNALGFEDVGRIPIGEEAINVFMNQAGDGDMPRLELTYNFGVDPMTSAAQQTWTYTACHRPQMKDASL